jgi:hypothetical protein
MLKDSRIIKGNGKGVQYLNFVIIAIVVVLIAIVLTKIFKSFKLGADTAGDIAGGVLIQHQTGITPARQTTCRSAARECEMALTRLPFFGTIAWIDHNRIIQALNSLISAKEAILTCEIFKTLDGHDTLKYIVDNDMQSQNQAKIKPIIRENLV